ncbi:hypothetical protein ACHAXA_008247 [Cyclostephanos tholiformis]|uniref:Uncharacterized protein n=1 Tax=Cyclostephanos tholiformis TaxID=382380 RepID=A0ABD3RAR7_9STRA
MNNIMTSPERRANPSHPLPDGSRSKRVTFANTNTSILIRSNTTPISPTNAKDRIRSLGTRRPTPRGDHPSRGGIFSSPSSRTAESASAVGVETTTNRLGTTPRLVESGAVRVRIARHTNARRGEGKRGSIRIIDSGAVRLIVTRHTAPRRLYATHGRIWSPPPPSSSNNRRRVPLSEHHMPGRGTDTTPSRRSNARVGGHEFLAALSSRHSTPVVRTVTYEENEDQNLCLESEDGLSRTLFN